MASRGIINQSANCVSFLCLDWDLDLGKKYFNVDAAEGCEKHESLEYLPQMKSFVKLKDYIELFTTKERPGADVCWDWPSVNHREIRFMVPVSSTCGTSQAFLTVDT